MSALPFHLSDASTERDLFALVARERLARDVGDWDLLEGSFWPDSVVRVTWFVGTAAEFVAMSRERAKGGSGMHSIVPVRTEVLGDRALVESRGQILIRPRVDGVQVDVTSWCRFFSRAERRDGTWRLVTFDSIYIKDRMDAVQPGDTLELDTELLAAGRESYRYLSYLNAKSGYTVPTDLPGADRPDLLDEFYAQADAWLHEV